MVDTASCASRAGGGSLPMLDLPSCCVRVAIQGISANAIEGWLRGHSPPVIGRIEDDRFIMDPRTLQEDELEIIASAFAQMLSGDEPNR